MHNVNALLQSPPRLGKTFGLSYPCIMLNVMVAEHNTNEQYATLVRAPPWGLGWMGGRAKGDDGQHATLVRAPLLGQG